MFWIIGRTIAKAGIGILTLPISLTIDRYILRKNGLSTGTFILVFIFVNAYWAIPMLGFGLEAMIHCFDPSKAFLGKEIASSFLILVGSYFYWLPAGCLFCLVFLALFRRKANFFSWNFGSKGNNHSHLLCLIFAAASGFSSGSIYCPQVWPDRVKKLIPLTF